jgi:hypothetical protein
VSAGHIDDDEVLYRRIPPGKDWFAPPDRISTFNFKLDLNQNEEGLSLYRKNIVNASEVLQKSNAKAGSKIAQATVGQIRSARDGKGNPLNLDVLQINDENDPGHVEIRGSVLVEHPKTAAKALKKLFKLIDIPPEEP